MPNSHSQVAPNPNTMPPAGLVARLQFAARRHFVLVTAIVALLSGVSAMTIVSSKTGILDREYGHLVVVLGGLWIVSIVVSLAPLLFTSRTHAKTADISAALSAATPEERPHLGAKLRERVSSRVWPEPISTFELAVIFDGVRAEHDDRKTRRKVAEKSVRLEQDEAIGSIGNSDQPSSRGRLDN